MMTNYRQHGMTLWQLMTMFLIGAFFLFLLFKIVPPYVSDYSAVSAVKRLAKRPESSGMTPEELRESIIKQFDIDNVTQIKPLQDIEIAGKSININYEYEVPMMGNLSVLIFFKHQIQVP
jgi:hypothetical protein